MNKVKSFISHWLFTTNHKEIGTLYFLFSISVFFIAGIMALLIRAELFQPGQDFLGPNTFISLTTMHGLLMVFAAVMPALAGFANWMIPLTIGAPDMAFPRMNNISFWILPVVGIILMSTFLMDSAPNFGWTMYAPLSTTYGPKSTDFLIFSIHLLGLSSIMLSINIIVTILNMRAPGMRLMKMPIFVWSWLVTAILLLAVMPVLAGLVTMMLMDRHFGTSFFSAAGGGDPVLYQHIFWFFGHPEVYVIILPAFGMISSIIPTFSRKKLFGYKSMIVAIAAITILSFLVWAHHMFTTGLPLAASLFFMYTTMLIAVPTGVKVFNWTATLFRGSLTFETPMLFALGFLFLFTIGGFSGLMLAIAPADYQYQDTYFVVGHFHYTMVAGALFSIFAGIYYWFPKWTGRMYSEKLGQWHYWLTVIPFNLTFFPMHFLGLAGMPRRVSDYALQFTHYNMLATVGAFILGFAQLIFVYNMIKSIRSGFRVKEAQVWEGAEGLEWTVPTPAPKHTFIKPPKFKE